MESVIKHADSMYTCATKDCIPYSGKVWQGESLTNLANHLRFAKLKPSKLVVTIDNPLADLLIRQTFFRQTLEKVDSPNILPAKLSRYTVYLLNYNYSDYNL